MKLHLSTFGLISLLCITVLFSCKNKENNLKELPDSVSGLKNLLTEKEKELAKTNQEIVEIKTKLSELDPSFKVESVVQVEIDTVQLVDYQHKVQMQGSVQARDEINISSETSGTITSLKVQEGDYVSKGQVIATINQDILQNQMAEIETSLDLARTLYEKQKRLWDQNIGSEVQYLQAKNNVERLENSLTVMRSQLSKGTVYSPISGVVDAVRIEQGELASPGMPIITVLNANRLQVEAEIPEIYLGKIRRGQYVDLFFPSLEKEMTGRVSLIGRKIDPANRTFTIEVNIGNPGGQLKPNLLAEVSFVDYQLDDVIIVPIENVQQEVGGRNYVMLAKQENDVLRAEKTYVIPGEYSETEVVIESGIQPGDIMISKGMLGLSPHQAITIIN